MSTSDLPFLARLKTAVTGASDTRGVFLGNFEVEQRWAEGEVGLPRIGASAGGAIVNRMDEFALLLAGKSDHVVLKSEPDPGYLHYLTDLGLDLPEVLVVADQDPEATVTEDALADETVRAELSRLAGEGCVLLPHGVSDREERLVELTGLALGAPSAALCKSVNSKIYSRRVGEELGLRQPLGWSCESVPELLSATHEARRLLDDGRQFVIKDAYGVSGKGLALISSRRRIDQVERLVTERARRQERDRIGLVVEEWVPKQTDLNYQLTVGRDGSVRFDFVKEALTEQGVHKGHRMPPRVQGELIAQVHDTAHRIGARLAADRFFGVVGVDAMISPAGELYPIVEINARNNMSTYQTSVQELTMTDESVALARHYPVRLDRPLAFDSLRSELGHLLFEPARGEGLLVNNFATVNAMAAAAGSSDGRGFDGRLYGIVIAPSAARVTAIDTDITARLAEAKGMQHAG